MRAKHELIHVPENFSRKADTLDPLYGRCMGMGRSDLGQGDARGTVETVCPPKKEANE